MRRWCSLWPLLFRLILFIPAKRYTNRTANKHVKQAIASQSIHVGWYGITCICIISNKNSQHNNTEHTKATMPNEHEPNCDSMFCVIFMCVWIDIDYIGSDIWWQCKQYASTMNIAIRLFRRFGARRQISDSSHLPASDHPPCHPSGAYVSQYWNGNHLGHQQPPSPQKNNIPLIFRRALIAMNCQIFGVCVCRVFTLAVPIYSTARTASHSVWKFTAISTQQYRMFTDEI